MKKITRQKKFLQKIKLQQEEVSSFDRFFRDNAYIYTNNSYNDIKINNSTFLKFNKDEIKNSLFCFLTNIRLMNNIENIFDFLLYFVLAILCLFGFILFIPITILIFIFFTLIKLSIIFNNCFKKVGVFFIRINNKIRKYNSDSGYKHNIIINVIEKLLKCLMTINNIFIFIFRIIYKFSKFLKHFFISAIKIRHFIFFDLIKRVQKDEVDKKIKEMRDNYIINKSKNKFFSRTKLKNVKTKIKKDAIKKDNTKNDSIKKDSKNNNIIPNNAINNMNSMKNTHNINTMNGMNNIKSNNGFFVDETMDDPMNDYRFNPYDGYDDYNDYGNDYNYNGIPNNMMNTPIETKPKRRIRNRMNRPNLENENMNNNNQSKEQRAKDFEDFKKWLDEKIKKQEDKH